MKILFLCPNYFGIYKTIEKGIKKQFNCELTSIIFEDYKYKNRWEKILNFSSKIFLKKNLKKKWASRERIKNIKPEDYFEYKDAGADAVFSATGAMWNPSLAIEIKEKAKKS